MRILIAQLDPTVGDIAGNTDKILDTLNRFGREADIIVLPELAISGYYPYDLLNRQEFIKAEAAAFSKILEATVPLSAAVVLGHIRKNTGPGKPLFNAVSMLRRGAVLHSTIKQLLPTFNIFAERRHFEPGGPGSVFEFKGVKLGFLVCEDIWNDVGTDYAVNPVATLVEQGAQLLISVNASPSNIGKQAQRQALVQAVSARHQVPVVYVNQVGATDEVVFDGASFAVMPEGLVEQSPAFKEAWRWINFEGGVLSARDQHNSDVDVARIAAYAEPAALAFDQAKAGLQGYSRKCRMPKVVVGSSGGVDSALTLALAVAALGAENVVAITMPSGYSSAGSVDDSVALCRNLKIQLYTMPIGEEFEAARTAFELAIGAEMSPIALENLQARIRGRKLMEFSNTFGHLVLSTGNKSECSVGYSTLYGDTNGGLNLLGDLYKMEVYALSRYINTVAALGEVIPQIIIDKAPSAELAPGQRDDDSLPPYPLLDSILKLYIEGDALLPDERARCETMVQGQELVTARVRRMVDNAEFKRRQAPPIIRMHPRAFGDGRRLPVAQGWRG